jgi:prepilin-type N-terminal cleavage/methylation domain-containing protein
MTVPGPLRSTLQDRRRPHRRAAFTLVEIVLALTIIAVIAAASLPVLRGLREDEKFRQPIQSLASLIQEARSRAIREHRSYQIVFEPRGIHASPVMYPYRKLEDFLDALEILRTPPEQTEFVSQSFAAPGSEEVTSSTPPPWQAPWTVSIPVDSETQCGVLFWGDGEWDVLDSGSMRRWVFQPAGLTAPASIRFRSDHGEMEADFDALTGELVAERTRALPALP